MRTVLPLQCRTCFWYEGDDFAGECLLAAPQWKPPSQDDPEGHFVRATVWPTGRCGGWSGRKRPTVPEKN